MSKPRPEDQQLASEQFSGINQQFYSVRTAPHLFIRQRIRALLLASSQSDQLIDAQERGVVVGQIRATYPRDFELLQEAALADYMLTESVILFHHSAETLVRLYLAHSGEPACPWLEMSRLRAFQFKDALKKLRNELREERTARGLMTVFYGSPEPPDAWSEEEGAAWPGLRDGLVDLLAACLADLEADNDLYNAAKHGLALLPGNAAMRYGDEDSPVDISASGPSLTYFQVLAQGPHKRWNTTTAWPNVELKLALTQIATRYMANLWTVAKARYVTREQPFDLDTVPGTLVADAMKQASSGKTFTVPEFSMQLVYYK